MKENGRFYFDLFCLAVGPLACRCTSVPSVGVVFHLWGVPCGPLVRGFQSVSLPLWAVCR